MANATNANKLYLVFAAMLLVLIGMTFITYRALSSLGDANKWNIHSYQVLGYLQGVSNGLDDMQQGAHAYLVAGDDASYQTYLKGKKALSQNYNNALHATVDNTNQQKRLKEFKNPLNQLFKYYIPVLKQRHATGNADHAEAMRALAAQLAPDRDTALADLRKDLNDLVNAEQALLDERAQSAASMENWAHTTLISDSILAVILASMLSIFLVRSNDLLQHTNEGLSNEISERKRAEVEIRDLHDYNEQILSSTTEGIIGINPRGRVTFANPAAATMIGWDLQQVIGKPIDSVLQRDMPNPTLAATKDNFLTSALKGGRAHSVADGTFTKRDGSQFSVEYTITALRAEDAENNEEEANVTGAVITFRDITIRKRTEISLLRLASIVESSKDAILSHTLEGRIATWNAAATSLYGYNPREVDGCSMSILFPPDRTEEVAYLLEKIKSGERVEPYQTVIQNREGEPVEVALTLYSVRDAKGEVMGATSNARRIIRRRAEEQLPVYMTELRLVKEPGTADSEASQAAEFPANGEAAVSNG